MHQRQYSVRERCVVMGNQGYTLPEIIVSMAIISISGLVLAVSLAGLKNAREKSALVSLAVAVESSRLRQIKGFFYLYSEYPRPVPRVFP